MNVETIKMERNTSPVEKCDSSSATSTMDAKVWIKVEKLEIEEWDRSEPTPTKDTTECDRVTVKTEAPEIAVQIESLQEPDEVQHVEESEVRLRCNICNRIFLKQSNLSRHIAICSQQTNRDCPICHKKLKDMHTLRTHLRKHDSETPFHCDICNMRFKYKCSVQRHKMLHETDKQYPCPVCGKRFMTKCLMKPHLRTHTNEKPFQCPICLNLFSQKHNMQRHMLRHNKIKYLSCEICHKEFPRESRLKYHMRVHWSDKKPFKCKHCAKCYSHKQNIVRHYRKKHPDQEYIAPDTDAGLATKAWEALMSKKQEENEDYILPELEPGQPDNSCQYDTDKLNGDDDDIDSCNGDGDEPRPELVIVNSCSDSDSDSVENRDDVLNLKTET